ncbi:universal stress protein [Bizionia paragorgiae]|uniref:universal stress protein n=1 Tax=Bizionia paragorgiae TaxID=283786 RepID=UPI003A8FCFDC
MENILLLTDFSENARNAMHYAHHLFKGKTINFFILHTKTPASYTTDDLMLAGDDSLYNLMFKEAKAKLDDSVLEFKKTDKENNFTYDTLVDYDVITDAIKQAILSNKIDLVIMGSNGATGAKEIVFGSNTIQVIRKVNSPTLIIPEGFYYRTPKHILLPLDSEDTLDHQAFPTLISFAEKFNSKLHVLRVKTTNEIREQKDIDKELQTIKDCKTLDTTYKVIEGVPIEFAVSCYTQTHKIDITSLFVQKEPFFERLFTGSSTLKITKDLRTPLLVLHT